MKNKRVNNIVTVLYPITMFACMTGMIISIICMFTDFGYGDIKINILQIIGCIACMIITVCVFSPIIDRDDDDKILRRDNYGK